MGCTYCYESSVGFLTSILVFDWLVDNFKAAAIGLLHFCGIGAFSAGSSFLRPASAALGLLWASFGPSSGLLYGPSSVLLRSLLLASGLPTAFVSSGS